MSKYTTEVRFICETFAGMRESQGQTKVEDIISQARTKIFNFYYPIFDEDYRPILEKNILRHFYTREIGQESVGLWQLALDKKLNDIMPYYNQLYNSTKLEFDPLTDISYTKSGSESLSTSESTESSLSTSESNSTSDHYLDSLTPQSYEWNLEQDTPQNTLTQVENMEYLTRAVKTQHGGTDRNAHDGNNSSSSQGESAGTTSRETLDEKGYLEKLSGYRNNNPSKLLQDYRETFLNIDLMIIGELEKLFFQLW